MNRNLFALMLIALMLISGMLGLCVLAETREETVLIEGEQESISTTYHKSEALEYSLWYDSELLVLSESDASDEYTPAQQNAPKGISLTVERRAQGTDMGEIAIELSKKMEKEYKDFNDYGSANELFVSIYPGSQTRILSGYASNRYEDVYLVDEGKRVYVITIHCPSSAEESFGSRLRQMLKTFQPY